MDHKVYVFVRDGNVEAVYSNDKHTEVVLVDCDNIKAGDENPLSKDEQVSFNDGSHVNDAGEKLFMVL